MESLWGKKQKLQDFLARKDKVSHAPIGLGCRIHQLHLCRGVRPPPNKCPRYDKKQSAGEDSVMLKLWGMRSTSSLPSLPGPPSPE